MKLKTTLTIVAAAFGLVIAGCSSQSKSKKEDKAETQSQAQSKEEESEMKEKEGEKKKEEKKEEKKKEKKEEHPGDKKEGEEHPGDKKEHPGDEKEGEEHPGDEAMNFNADDIKTAMKKHIKSQSNDGVFTIQDKKEGKELKLEFVKIHDPVREMTEKGSYFGCTDFHVKGNADKVYDLDFWLKPKGESLEVVRSKVHKHPKKKNGEWVKEARYTFKNNEVVAVE